MVTQRHTSLTLRTQVGVVAESLARCQPNDPFALQRLFQQLLALRASLERDSARELAPACTLAIRVIEQLQQPSPRIEGALAMEIVTGLVGVVCGAIGLEGVVDPPSEVRAATGTEAVDQAPAKAPEKADARPEAKADEKSAAARLSKTGRQPSLKLVSSRKLGEMLTQMSLLTPTQVERALNHQRVTGCRFGEALIEMRILTREAVESALRMQDARRGPRGPWGNR